MRTTLAILALVLLAGCGGTAATTAAVGAAAVKQGQCMRSDEARCRAAKRLELVPWDCDQDGEPDYHILAACPDPE